MKLFIVLLACTATAVSQPFVVSSTVLPLPEGVQWFAPRFAPDGGAVYVTTAGYNGIWEYDISANRLRMLTNDPGAGYDFSVSAVANTLAYRRTLVHENGFERTQEIVRLDLRTGEKIVVASAPTLSTPLMLDGEIVYTIAGSVKGRRKSPGEARLLLGMERTKIVLLESGKKRTLDPIPHGSYIWPALSPDGKSLAAFEISRGLFVSGLDGNNMHFLGRYNAPSWTSDGKWIVMMNDKDDGHQIISSDLVAVRVDGGNMIQLTSTDDIIELYPHCSPVDNRIVCATEDGRILLLTYSFEEEK